MGAKKSNRGFMQEIIERIEAEIKPLFDSEKSGHDIYHLKRVLNLALKIQKKEGGDKLVVGVSAFLHDLHRIIEERNGKYCEPKDSLPEIRKILEKTCLAEEKIEKILHCIEFHEEYSFSSTAKTVKDIETLIVQDADNLDAIGAIGIGRTFYFGGAHNVPMWVPEIRAYRKTFDETVLDPSTVHHFYSKLLKLKENMNTKTGKRIALQRHEFMKTFLDEFSKEWQGKK